MIEVWHDIYGDRHYLRIRGHAADGCGADPVCRRNAGHMGPVIGAVCVIVIHPQGSVNIVKGEWHFIASIQLFSRNALLDGGYI